MDFHSCNKYEQDPLVIGTTNRLQMRFIGKDGSMGLEHGSVHWVRIYNNSRYIFVVWENNGCPYSSLRTLTQNWENV